MIHSWELALVEIFLPLIAFHFGKKYHWSLAWLFAGLAFAYAEWCIYEAAVNHWIVK